MKTGPSILLIVLFFSGFLNIRAQEAYTRETGNFSTLSVTGNIRVEIYPSDSPSLEFTVKGASPEDVITEKKDKELSIRLKSNASKDAVIKVKLFYTELEKISVQSRALVVSPDTLRADAVVFDARLGGKTELKLKVNTLEAIVRQGGLLVFYGEVDTQTISVASGGTYSAYELEAQETSVRAATGGNAKVVARRMIDADASAKAWIGYKGDPESKKLNTSIGGEIASIKEE